MSSDPDFREAYNQALAEVESEGNPGGGDEQLRMSEDEFNSLGGDAGDNEEFRMSREDMEAFGR